MGDPEATVTGTPAKTATLGVRAGPTLLRSVDDLATRAGLTRSEVVRLALVRLSEQGIPEGLDAAALRAARRTD